MINNLENSNLKRKIIISPIMGVISIILLFLLFLSSVNYQSSLNYQSWLFFLSLLGATISAVIGLILGVKGLKLPKKILAILGITLSLIGVLPSLYMLYAWLIAGGPFYL